MQTPVTVCPVVIILSVQSTGLPQAAVWHRCEEVPVTECDATIEHAVARLAGAHRSSAASARASSVSERMDAPIRLADNRETHVRNRHRLLKWRVLCFSVLKDRLNDGWQTSTMVKHQRSRT